MLDDRMLDLAKLMDVASLRAKVHAGNIANQDTPGYKARAVRFEDSFAKALEAGDTEEARDISPEIYERQGGSTRLDGNNVSMESEVDQATRNQLLYNTYLAMFKGKSKLLFTSMGSNF